ncbi:hypothetical protein EXS45_00660 [Candidatus Nomurabacteria bacterium]|nr:hypothetical protein [Candidatus Nomurabacteria bacterium]
MIGQKKNLISGLVIILVLSIGVFSYFYYDLKHNTTPVQPSVTKEISETTSPISNDKNQDRVIGILEIPNLPLPEEGFEENGKLIKPLKIYNLSKNGTLVTTAMTFQDLELKEYTYEGSGVVIYKMEDQSYQIKLNDGTKGWIMYENKQVFHPIENLLSQGMAYLTTTWNGKLYATPEMKQATDFQQTLSYFNSESSINVLDIKKDSNGQTWMKIQIITSPCTNGESKTLEEGWIPMYSTSGDLNAWFYSRGC